MARELERPEGSETLIDAPEPARTGLLTEHARTPAEEIAEQQHRIAVELQRGLLPRPLPDLPGFELAAHYRPAGAGAEVGGDWYDVCPLSEGRLGIVLGDVAGSGIPAASAMGQLRSATRAFALGSDPLDPPGEVLTRLSHYQLAVGDEQLFTVIYTIVDPRASTLWWASAGHVPPLLRTSGATRYLEGAAGPMGIGDVVYETCEAALGPQDTLILYTDGLVERRGESPDSGLQRLARAAAAGPREPAALCEHILGWMLPTGGPWRDDVTALLVKLT